ncbi:MAG: mandelate racemase [Rhodospirillales bacterium CG15_BIG_FIL_POST_REV_8_21_14_020_66_15]|nr:MAG: mandelate racemase [Rhodospirillales bacterium CG15_BIG_FIL_POST_REV_8_21_14_020_66_15]
MTDTIANVRARPVIVPMRRPLATAGGAVSEAPLILVDVETASGIVGRAYSFAYHAWALRLIMAMYDVLADRVRGQALDPAAVQEKLWAAFRLLGAKGAAGQAISGLDMALWDAAAKEKGRPLYKALGAEATATPAYNSKGLGMIGAEAAGREARELLDEGFGALKVRLGYPTLEEDVAVVRAVKAAVPEGTPVMSDYNQSQEVEEVIRRMKALDAEGLYWVEEPVHYDDFYGHAALRAVVKTPVQTGENCWFPGEMAKCMAAGACDYFMPDAGKIGGVTGWRGAARLAAAANLPISSHLYPEISVHLLAATPTRHWLEYVDWAEPVLAEPLPVVDGKCTPPEKPGIGIEWNERAVDKYAV